MRSTLRQTTRPGRRRRSVNHVANPEDERVETGYERADRNLNELLQELRVALPGVQVLFGFLLTVPFMERFQKLPRPSSPPAARRSCSRGCGSSSR